MPYEGGSERAVDLYKRLKHAFESGTLSRTEIVSKPNLAVTSGTRDAASAVSS